MTYSKAIIKRINDLFKDRKITVNRLADLSGIRQSTIENIVGDQDVVNAIRTLVDSAGNSIKYYQ